MAIKHRMNGAFGRHANIAVEPPDQEFPDLARAPMPLLGFEPNNQGLDLSWQLVGITDRAAWNGRSALHLVLELKLTPEEKRHVTPKLG
jgi:hypothetical protein